MNEVLFPEMRANVIDAVKSLADEEYQWRVWVDKKYPTVGYYDDFWVNVNLLFDDSLVLENPRDSLGAVLINQSEVAAMEDLAKSVLDFLESQGRDKSDAEYVSSPEWSVVVSSARRAYATLRSSPADRC